MQVQHSIQTQSSRSRQANNSNVKTMLPNYDLETIKILNNLDQLTEPGIVSTEFERNQMFAGTTPFSDDSSADPDNPNATNYQHRAELAQMTSSNATYYDANIPSSSDEATIQDNLISINSGRYRFGRASRNQGRKQTAWDDAQDTKVDPWENYQPIVKNLKNMTLRNRNLLQMSTAEKVKMPSMSAQKLHDKEPGTTKMP